MWVRKLDGAIIAMLVSILSCINIARLAFLKAKNEPVLVLESYLLQFEIVALLLLTAAGVVLARITADIRREFRSRNEELAAIRHARVFDGLWERLCLLIVMSVLGIPLGFGVAFRIGSDLQGFLFLETIAARVNDALIMILFAYAIWRYFRRRIGGKPKDRNGPSGTDAGGRSGFHSGENSGKTQGRTRMALG